LKNPLSRLIHVDCLLTSFMLKMLNNPPVSCPHVHGRRGISTPEALGKTLFFSLPAAGGSEMLSPSDLRTVDEVHPEKVGYDGKASTVFSTFPGA
jgi:hypothetical protein